MPARFLDDPRATIRRVALSGNQMRKLGKRLADSDYIPSDDDLELLDQYERTFAEPIAHVINVIRTGLGRDPTARPMKTVTSIVEKIRRQHTSLPTMQDIAGCRLTVQDVVEQDAVVDQLVRMPWEKCRAYDLRPEPHNGYRAVHVVVTVSGLPVEIQIRTRLQDLWAQISERMSDRFGREVKYGGGPDAAQDALSVFSEGVLTWEENYLLLQQARLAAGSEEEELVLALHRKLDEEHEQLVEQLRLVLTILTS